MVIGFGFPFLVLFQQYLTYHHNMSFMSVRPIVDLLQAYWVDKWLMVLIFFVTFNLDSSICKHRSTLLQIFLTVNGLHFDNGEPRNSEINLLAGDIQNNSAGDDDEENSNWQILLCCLVA